MLEKALNRIHYVIWSKDLKGEYMKMPTPRFLIFSFRIWQKCLEEVEGFMPNQRKVGYFLSISPQGEG
jgi:hypothetical protein